MAVTFNQLAYFLAVARAGSVSVAAERLFVTQPSVSAALASLADELGVALTERDGRAIRLTSAGRALVPYATDVLGLLDQGRQAAREAASSSERRLRIAAVTTAGEYVAPPLLHAFAALRPDIALTLEVGNRASVFERVNAHEADVGIGGRPPEDGRLIGPSFLRNEVVVVTAPDDPLAARRAVPVEELAGRTWLMREEGSGTRLMVEEFLARHGLAPETLTLGSNGAIKHAVRLGLGISIESRIAVELELDSGALGTIAVRGGIPVRQWYALRSAVGPVREPLQAFLEFVTSSEAQEAVEEARHAWSLRRRVATSG